VVTQTESGCWERPSLYDWLGLCGPDQLASFVVWFRNIRFRFVGSGRPRQLWRFAGIGLGKFVGKAHRNRRLFPGQSWLYPPLVVGGKVKNCRRTNHNRDSRHFRKRLKFPSCDGEVSNEGFLFAARFVILGAQN